jgi:hypothetical protein
MKRVMSMDYTDLLQTNNISGLETYLRDHDVNKEVLGQSPLYWAVFQNNVDFCKILIVHGAHVNHQDRFGRTALSAACYFEFTAIAKLLLEHQATIDTQCMRRAYYGWDGHIQVEVLHVLAEHGWINLYLDDLRVCPEGFTVARTMDEAIQMMKKYNIYILSLDHDLGEDANGNLLPTGYDLVKFICENNMMLAIVHIHTDNVVGRENMYQTLLAAQRRGFIDKDMQIYYYPITENRYF